MFDEPLGYGLKKFSEMRQSTDLYNGLAYEVPAEVQQALADYFDDWLVFNNELFPQMFRSVVNRYFLRYSQLLRIEAGIAKYDWLVEKIGEFQSYTKTGEETTRELTGSGSGSVIKSTSSTDTGGNTEEKTTSEEKAGSNNIAINRTGASTQTQTTATTDTPGVTETQRRQGTESSTSQTDGESTTATTSKGVSKAMPQSMSYQNTGDGAIPVLDWGSPSTQSQEESDVQGTSETSTTGSGESDYTTTTTRQGTDSTSTSGTIGVEEVGSQTTAGSNSETTDTTVSIQGTSSLQKTGTENVSNTGTKSENSSATKEEGRLHRRLTRSRDTSIQQLLSEAVAFIQSTSAINFLIDKLEPLFICVWV